MLSGAFSMHTWTYCEDSAPTSFGVVVVKQPRSILCYLAVIEIIWQKISFRPSLYVSELSSCPHGIHNEGQKQRSNHQQPHWARFEVCSFKPCCKEFAGASNSSYYVVMARCKAQQRRQVACSELLQFIKLFVSLLTNHFVFAYGFALANKKIWGHLVNILFVFEYGFALANKWVMYLLAIIVSTYFACFCKVI